MKDFFFYIVIFLFMLVGVFSFIRPETIGADFYWRKIKGLYYPSWRKTTNPQYQRQIKIVGIGMFFAGLFSMIYFSLS